MARAVPVAFWKRVLPLRVVEEMVAERFAARAPPMLKAEETVELPRMPKEEVVALVRRVALPRVVEASMLDAVELNAPEMVVLPVTARAVVVPACSEKFSPVMSPALLMEKSVVVEKVPATLEVEATAKRVVRYTKPRPPPQAPVSHTTAPPSTARPPHPESSAA
jgi:hypothetical protein